MLRCCSLETSHPCLLPQSSKFCSGKDSLRVPWATKRSNQSILKEINPNIHWQDCWLSWSSNNLATWCKASTLWKRPQWKIEGKRRRGQQRIRWLDSITDSMDMNFSKLQSGGQGSLVHWSTWGHRDWDMTWWLNNNNKNDV